MQKYIDTKIFQLALYTVVIVLIGGVLGLLLQVHASSQASGASVVGPPSLPAATVNAIFARLGSPMVGTGNVVVQAATKTHIDNAFALAVWWTETNTGAAGVGLVYHNPGGVRGSPGFPVGKGGYTVYSSFSAGVVDWFAILRQRYVNRGLTTVYAISHPYVGTSSSPLWAAKVTNLMLRYRSEAPPITTVKPTLHSLNTDKPMSAVSTTPAGHGQTPENSTLPRSPGWVVPSIIALLVALMLAIWYICVRVFRKPQFSLVSLIISNIPTLERRLRRGRARPCPLPNPAPLFNMAALSKKDLPLRGVGVGLLSGVGMLARDRPTS